MDIILQNAINRIKNGIATAQGNIEKGFREDESKAAVEELTLTLHALEKQEPMKLKVANPYEGCTLYGCPKCDHMGKHLWEFGIKTKCCPECGQTLDWGEQEK